MASLGGSGAQVVELAAERGQAIALGREASGRRVGLRLKFGERFARRLALGVEFLGACATFLEANALLEQPAGSRKPFQLGKLETDGFVGLGLLGLAARKSELAFDFGQHVVDAREIFAHALELALAHLAPSLEQRQPGGLFDHPAQSRPAWTG